jgi:hypothetical protein
MIAEYLQAETASSTPQTTICFAGTRYAENGDEMCGQQGLKAWYESHPLPSSVNLWSLLPLLEATQRWL